VARPKTFTVESALDRTIPLFRQYGYHNTSTQMIADHLRLSRSSIHATFATKQELFEQVLRHYGTTFRVPGLRELDDAASPRTALLQVFEFAIADDGGYEPCLLINSALELPRRTPEVTAILQAAFGDLETRFRKAIERAMAVKEIASDVEAVQTARALVCLYLGLHVLVRSGDAGQPAQRAVVLQVQGLVPETGNARRSAVQFLKLACALFAGLRRRIAPLLSIRSI
jgi:AcrR family transcriptional regulator